MSVRSWCALLVALCLVLFFPGGALASEPSPDPAVRALEVDPAVPQDGDSLGVTVIVENRGAAAAEGITVLFTLSQGDSVAGYVERLAPGENATVTREFPRVEHGSHTVTVETSLEIGEGAPVDAEPANNARSLEFEVGEGALAERPDLALRNVTTVPRFVESDYDGPVTYEFQVVNRGRVDADAFTVHYVRIGYTDGRPAEDVIGTARVAGLAAGAATVLAFETAQYGSGHQVTLRVDPEDAIGEAREDNNEADGQPDGTVTATEGGAGGSGTVRATAPGEPSRQIPAGPAALTSAVLLAAAFVWSRELE